MENVFITAPTVAQVPLIDFADAEYAQIIEDAPIREHQTVSKVNFLEANTDAISMEDLVEKCVVPTWANQELTIAHQDFINCVYDAAKDFYQGENVNNPDIRVSHIVRGRIPSALQKRASELLECEKTQFYQRLAFAFTIPTIYETVAGERLELCVGGVRNYNDLNLYRTSKGVEKFSVFVGWRVNICSNQILTGDGLLLQIEVTSLHDLYQRVMQLFQNFNPAKQIHLMQQLCNSSLSEHQFCQIIGRMRLYQSLPTRLQREIPQLLITDTQINNVAKSYITDENFSSYGTDINMWKFYNLLTGANKSSYIDMFLDRSVNATEIALGINAALHGEERYKWFID